MFRVYKLANPKTQAPMLPRLEKGSKQSLSWQAGPLSVVEGATGFSGVRGLGFASLG